MEVGIVRSFGSSKNGQPISYGWIERQGSLAEYLQRKCTSSSSDIFVHRSNLLCSVDALQKGVFVLFEVEVNPKKNKEEACNVKLLKEIGIIKWFGNYNSKTNKENDFGFIEQLRYNTKDNIFGEKTDIRVHQSQINSLADRLKEGVLVTFGIRKNFITKRDEAVDVNLLFEED